MHTTVTLLSRKSAENFHPKQNPTAGNAKLNPNPNPNLNPTTELRRRLMSSKPVAHDLALVIDSANTPDCVPVSRDVLWDFLEGLPYAEYDEIAKTVGQHVYIYIYIYIFFFI